MIEQLQPNHFFKSANFQIITQLDRIIQCDVGKHSYETRALQPLYTGMLRIFSNEVIFYTHERSNNNFHFT